MAWDKGEPHEGILAPDLNDVLRDNNDALEAALDAWIRFETGGTQSGQPRQGSARPYFQDSAPTARLDGEYFDSTDLGTVWIDTNATPDNQFNILTAADGAGTETWTPISTEAIAILVAQINTWALAQTFSATAVFSVPPTFTLGAVLNNAYLTAKNAAGDGTVDLMKADGSDVPTVPDDTANATSGAPTADASLANKKYVDDQITAQVPVLARARGWAYIDTNGTILASYNVSGVVRNGTGDYTVSWDTDFASANYGIMVSSYPTATEVTIANIVAQAAGNTQVKVYRSFETATVADTKFMIVAFGAQ